MAGNRTSLISESGFDSFKGKASAAMGGKSMDKDKLIKIGAAVVMLLVAGLLAMYQLGFFAGKPEVSKSAKQPPPAEIQKALDDQQKANTELQTKTGVVPMGS